jgi:hypothetical protein
MANIVPRQTWLAAEVRGALLIDVDQSRQMLVGVR